MKFSYTFVGVLALLAIIPFIPYIFFHIPGWSMVIVRAECMVKQTVTKYYYLKGGQKILIPFLYAISTLVLFLPFVGAAVAWKSMDFFPLEDVYAQAIIILGIFDIGLALYSEINHKWERFLFGLPFKFQK